MPRVISDSGLVCCLKDLKEALSGFDPENLNNIIFLNAESFYAYLSTRLDGNFSACGNFEELMNIIEPYIPLTVSDSNFETFLNAAMNNNAKEVEKLERSFIDRSKVKFIRIVCGMENGAEWESLVNTCRTIRNYKAQKPGMIRL